MSEKPQASERDREIASNHLAHHLRHSAICALDFHGTPCNCGAWDNLDRLAETLAMERLRGVQAGIAACQPALLALERIVSAEWFRARIRDGLNSNDVPPEIVMAGDALSEVRSLSASAIAGREDTK